MNRASLLVYFALGLGLTGSAHAMTFKRTALSGVPLKLAHYAMVNPDCTSGGRPEVRIDNSPTHGAVRLLQTADFSRFALYSYSMQCSYRRVAGVSLVFQSEKAFVGTDYLAVDVIYPNGLERNDTYELTVK